ncbi:hypothetical protein AVW11_15655 [Streptomyces amritsarensis]|uniref:Large ribosomal subunit protein bL12 C-terminal domain-containing protein n=1 Tax=Streptomyces amritsarensis TaxID=681158 RepID=A0ABX3G2T5_9ACTN|nr:ribosomal protein L7/L12 [Streptomyces amritsarensis]OLZ66301.1 hypothetical protein AVW11_15655 [Streptomyces amritsarensis]
MEEPGFCVLLKNGGSMGIDTVKAIRSVTGISLWESKRLVEAAPTMITEPDWLESADAAAEAIAESGAHVAVVCDWCSRIVDRANRPLDPAPCVGPWPPGSCRASSPPLPL